MVQQMQTMCPTCKGEGTCIKDEDKCKNCKGEKVLNTKKVFEVHIEKGMAHNEKIVFSQEADQHPDIKIPGDLVIVLQEKKHDRFTRQGKDLLMTKKISLRQALCGFSFPVEHLDKRVLLVKSVAGEIISPGQIKSIPNEGMPAKGNPFDKGELLIKFEIEMPSELTEEQVTGLAKLLPQSETSETAEPNSNATEPEECFLHSYTQQKTSDNMSEDEEDEQQGQRAQCVHQ
eukprot:TRINITY_DN67827_c6_g2_i3.p1 TRINITY_DN67827_c6_g2~~TRINITY_DN67827_c6_g2_i3.p1  ORF type:complete len:231 (+),score=48.38 TRINITY_DN67827_c6_g2_i3:206-898(+)